MVYLKLTGQLCISRSQFCASHFTTKDIIKSLDNIKEGDPIANAETLAIDSIENLMKTLNQFLEKEKK